MDYCSVQKLVSGWQANKPYHIKGLYVASLSCKVRTALGGKSAVEQDKNYHKLQATVALFLMVSPDLKYGYKCAQFSSCVCWCLFIYLIGMREESWSESWFHSFLLSIMPVYCLPCTSLGGLMIPEWKTTLLFKLIQRRRWHICI